MRLAKLASFVSVLTLGLSSGCGKETAKQSGSTGSALCPGASAVSTSGSASGSTSGSASGAALADCAPLPMSTAPVTTAPAVTAASGLLEFCKWNANDKGGGCMTCTPRELDILQCAANVKADFNPAKDCTSDADKLVVSCKVGAGADFVFDFSQPSPTESAFEKMPLLVLGAHFLINEKLKDDAKKDIINGAIDIFSNHAKDILNNKDVTPTVDELIVLIKKAKPTTKAAEITQLRTQVIAAVTTVQTKRKTGDFKDSDLIGLLLGFVSSMPSELTGEGAKTLDINTLVGALSGSGDAAGILGALVGSGSASASGS